MRHTSYYINPTSSATTAFADSYQSFEEALKSFAIIDISGKHRQISSTDESVQIYHYGGIYLYIIREDNPMFTYATLCNNLDKMLNFIEQTKVEDCAHKRFLAYQMWLNKGKK
jgi:hypothetical protein